MGLPSGPECPAGLFLVLDYPFGKGREAFIMENHTRGSIHLGFVDTLRSGASRHSEMVHFEIRRTPDFDVTLSHVTDFPNARQALLFRFFHYFRKKFKKVAPKAGTG